MNFKKSAAITAIVIIFFLPIGCATHTRLKQPSLLTNMEAQKNKRTTDHAEILVRPVILKSDLRLYYDENLVFYGVLPVQVCVKNTDANRSCQLDVEKIFLVDPDGTSKPPLTLDEVYKRGASKSYGYAAAWAGAFGIFGLVPSAINVAYVNKKVKADYDSNIMKSGELVSGAYTEGSLFFEIDNQIDSLDGWELQFDLEFKDFSNFVTFGLAGEFDQLKVPNNKSKSVQ